MNKVNFLILLKYLVFIFFIWIYHTYNDVVPFGKSLDNIYKQDKILSIKFNRLLARIEHDKEVEHIRLREKLPERRLYKSERITCDNLSTYSGLKSKATNNIELYMKNYKKRHMKKKGLSKLDCYYENKVFKKFCDISDIANKMKYDEKRSKKFFLKKYGLCLILFALMPLLGSIYLILFGINTKMIGILGPCPDEHFESNDHKKNDGLEDCSKQWVDREKELLEKLECANMIFTIFMVSFVILFIIYILIKVIKYEKIKAGKGKMNLKEYCRFCKEIF